MKKLLKINFIFIFSSIIPNAYAGEYYKITSLPKDKIKYVEKYVDSVNRDIQFDQSFQVCLKSDCFYVVPNKVKDDVEDDYRDACSVNIIDSKYNEDKDPELIAESEIEEKNWRPHTRMWHDGPSYEAIRNNICNEYPTVQSIAFINEKENQRPIILLGLNMGTNPVKLIPSPKYRILTFNGFKYREFQNKKLEDFMEKSRFNKYKSAIEVKRKIEEWIKNGEK